MAMARLRRVGQNLCKMGVSWGLSPNSELEKIVGVGVEVVGNSCSSRKDDSALGKQPQLNHNDRGAYVLRETNLSGPLVQCQEIWYHTYVSARKPLRGLA